MHRYRSLCHYAQRTLALFRGYLHALQALRVLSSIRLKVIVQIIILAIKKCITDTSPYVRKTAAHAIAKVYKYAAHFHYLSRH